MLWRYRFRRFGCAQLIGRGEQPDSETKRQLEREYHHGLFNRSGSYFADLNAAIISSMLIRTR